MLINDGFANPAYNVDFTKFLSTVMGGQSGPGNPAVAGPGASTHGYY
jgi:hypothetical protein